MVWLTDTSTAALFAGVCGIFLSFLLIFQSNKKEIGDVFQPSLELNTI